MKVSDMTSYPGSTRPVWPAAAEYDGSLAYRIDAVRDQVTATATFTRYELWEIYGGQTEGMIDQSYSRAVVEARKADLEAGTL